MITSPQERWAFLGGIVALFAVTIAFGLRARARQQGRGLALKAREVWDQARPPVGTLADLLFGVWHDYSAVQTGMIVRDGNDHHVATVKFHLARQTWAEIECDAGTYVLDVQPTVGQTVTLRAQNQDVPLCTFTRSFRGDFRFVSADGAVLESRVSRAFRLTPKYAYVRAGKTVGFAQHIGGWLDHGRMLVLPASDPLWLRLFALTMQSRRA